MNNAQKKVLAKEIYLSQDITQKALAKRVGVMPKTMSKWIKEGQWGTIKAATLTTSEAIENRYLRQIDAILEGAEKEGRVITDAEADRIAKINKSLAQIRNTDYDLATYIQVFKEYNNYLVSINPELARLNNIEQDKFINIKAIGK